MGSVQAPCHESVIFHRPTSEGGREREEQEREEQEQEQEQEREEQKKDRMAFFDPDAYHIESVGGILYHRFHT